MPDLPVYKRKCTNWIQSFKDWVMPRCESSEKLILWTAVWTIAAAVRRRIYIPRTSGLGGWDCYPYQYTMFVAPPGMRKTTTVGFAIDLLETIPDFPQSPTFITQTALVQELIKSEDCSLYLTMEEFGDLIIKGGKEMYEFLTSMYDGKKRIRMNTAGRGLELATNPTINLLAGTTPRWIAKNLDESLIGGGFASRVLWVYENNLRWKKLWYEEAEIKKAMAHQEKLTADLIHISGLAGEFKVTDECKKKSEEWYNDIEKNYKGFKFEGYINRKHVQALKIAMCLRLAYTDELILEWEDFRNGIVLLESIESQLGKVFSGIGKNTYSVELQDILGVIQSHKSIAETELRQAFKDAAEPNKLTELIEGLLLMGLVERKSKDGKTYLEPRIVNGTGTKG